MDLNTLLEILAWVVGVIFTFFMGYLAWLFKRLHVKVEDSISRKELQNVETKLLAVIAEKESAATKEIISVKQDTRNMADSVVKAVKSLEERLDTLMFHLLNQGGKK